MEMATSAPASAGAGKISAITTLIATEAIGPGGGSQVIMTIGGYSKLVEALVDAGGSINSGRFRAGGHSWYIEYHHEINQGDASSDDDDDDAQDWVTVFLCLDHAGGDYKNVEAEGEYHLLGHSGKRIQSIRDYNTFSRTSNRIDIMGLYAGSDLEAENSFRIWCHLTVVDVTEVKPLYLHRDLARLLASKVGGDVTFVVAGETFTAHRCVLAARSEVFKAEFFGPGKENAAATHVRIDDMEPKVFEALLHFIYTDTLPEVNKSDKITMAPGLLVAADRYGMRRLGWICEDILRLYVDAGTAVATLKLAKKHVICSRVKEACIESLKDLLAEVDH
jgi:speckle-type POZ protein